MSDSVILYVIVFLYGLIFGSFFNVCIYRIPAGLSVIRPRSRCGSCEHVLGWRDLIPVLSHALLGGKCRYCGAKVSIRYSVVELLTGVLFLWTTIHFGFTVQLIKHLILVSLLILITFIDWDHQIIPDRLNAGIAVLAVLSFLIEPQVTLMSAGLGFLLGGGLLFLIAILTGAMGGGDIKLMAAAGLFLGLSKTGVALYLGFILGGVVSLLLLLFKLKKRKDAIAFGPYLSLGIYIAALYGDAMLSRYFGQLM